MAQAVFQGHAGAGMATAHAALGAAGNDLAAGWSPPLPAWQPQPVAMVDPPAPVVATQVEQLSQRGAAWISLSAPMREMLDAAASGPARRAPWRRLVVEGTGEAAGGARDLAFAIGRRPAPSDPGYRAAHFVVGNGTRSADGCVERTSRPLDGASLVVALVGDFARQEPSPAQLRALTEVVDYARAKTGMIPVEPGEAACAPLTTTVLRAAFNRGLAVDPAPATPDP